MTRRSTFPAWFNATTIAVAILFLISVSCSSWKGVPLDKVTSGEKQLVGKEVRFHKAGAVWELLVHEVELPMVRGVSKATKTPVELDLREITLLEVKEINGWTTFLVVAVAVTLVVILIVVVTGDDDDENSTAQSDTTSCPIVYVEGDGEPLLVGEAYGGAIFRSVQRDDLMALPDPSGRRLRVLLANAARETQYTDVAELITVHHRPRVRVVATHDQDVLPVGRAAEPSRVADFSGAEFTTVLNEPDHVYWETDASGWVSEPNGPVRDGLIATFPKPRAGKRPVLELTLSNTDWLETVVQRFFGLMGDDFDTYLARGNAPAAGPLVRNWIEREGVSLEVEWKNGDRWDRVGLVPPVGPMAFRSVAVPLPEAAAARGVDEIELRVTGGSGFWRIDSMELSTVLDEPIDVKRTPAVSALDRLGVDSKDALARVDGDYQVLDGAGDWLRVEFDAAPASIGRERTLFLFTNGYYNLHPPQQGEAASSEVVTIMNVEGSLARFGMDLYRTSYEAALKRPARTAITE